MALKTDLKALKARLETTAGDVKESLDRFVSEAEFVERLCELHEDKTAQWTGLLDQATTTVKAAVDAGSLDAIPAAVASAEAILAPVGEVAKTYTVYNVGHGHIDMNWMWSWPETVSVTNDTFSTVLRLMDEYPDFCYSQSQASVYDICRKDFPELFERIKARVKEGRWEITASQWVEGDKNISGGESLCRHLLYTRKFMQEHFDLTPDDIVIDWEPDTFGHANTIPMVLTKGGVKRYYSCRQGVPRPPAFWWKAPDDTRVLVFKEMEGSWYNGDTTHKSVLPNFIRFCKETGVKAWMNVYGVGDHGGGPTRQHIDTAHKLDTWPIYPNMKLSTSKPIYDLLEANGDALPELEGELNFEFTGCYTTQTRIKHGNRHCEQILLQAEAASSLAWAEKNVEYPADGMEEGWVNVLFNQFHDILPGSGVRETIEHGRGLYQESEARANAATARSLRVLADSVDTSSLGPNCPAIGDGIGAGAGFGSGEGAVSSFDGGAQACRPFVVFNLNAWKRTDVVEALVWDTGWEDEPLKVSDDAGNEFAAQVIDKGHYWGHTYITVAFPAIDIPAMGRRTYIVSPGDAEPAKMKLSYDDGIENAFVKVKVDNLTGGISSLIEKSTGSELVKDDSPMGLLELITERAHGMSAWVIGQTMKSEMLLELKSLNHAGGPYKSEHTAKILFGDSTVDVKTIVRAGDPKVEIKLNVFWRERGNNEKGVPNLRITFPSAVEDMSSTFETPYGSVGRELFNGEEVPTLTWVDIAGKVKKGGKTGFTLVNDCKNGHSITDDTLRVTLLRASYEPDPLPDQADHEIRVAVIPHDNDWTPGDSIRAGRGFGQPVQVIGTGVHSGDLTASGSWMEIETANVVLGSLKKAENSDALILRLFETDGKNVTAKVKLPGLSFSNAQEVDVLERSLDTNSAKVEDGSLWVAIPANGLVSVKLS
jgi:alpha-mannosidase